MKVNFLMIHHITKVTIYRVQKLKPDAKEVDLFLQFRNPNMSKAQIQFYPLLESQAQGKDLNIKLDLPVGQINIDASEQYKDSSQSVADSATTNVKAIVAANESDHDFVYKKHDNFVVLLFKMKLPEGFKIEELTELTLGFQLMTSSSRFNQEPFDITTPVLMNVGSLKAEAPARPQQQQSQHSSRQSVTGDPTRTGQQA